MERGTPEEQRYLGLTPTQLNFAVLGVFAAIALAVGAYFGGADAVGDLFEGGEAAPAVTEVDEATPTPEPADGEGEEDTQPEPTPDNENDATGTPAPVDAVDAAAAQAAVDSALLTLADLPLGWVEAPPDEDDPLGDDFGEGFGEECGAEFEDVLESDTFPGEIASAESKDFDGPAGQSASNSASAFESEADAAAAMQLFDEFFAACGGEFEQLIVDGIADLVAADGEDAIDWQADASMERVPFHHMGQRTIAYRILATLSTEGLTLQVKVDMAAYQQGRMAGMLMFTTLLGVDDETEKALAGVAARKLADANASFGGEAVATLGR